MLLGSTALGLVLIFSAVINSSYKKTRVEVDYGQLQKLLREEYMEEAVQESYEAMLEVAGHQAERRRYITETEFKKFPCEDLRRLDDLWKEAGRDDIEEWGSELSKAAVREQKDKGKRKYGIIKGDDDKMLLKKRADECGL